MADDSVFPELNILWYGPHVAYQPLIEALGERLMYRVTPITAAPASLSAPLPAGLLIIVADGVWPSFIANFIPTALDHGMCVWVFGPPADLPPTLDAHPNLSTYFFDDDDSLELQLMMALYAYRWQLTELNPTTEPALAEQLLWVPHERGLRVSGHIPAGMRATDAIDAGYDEIEAMEFVLDKMKASKNNIDFFDMMRRGG